MTTLHPIHKSMWGKPGWRPRNMDRWKAPSPEHKDAAMNVALSIFADCSNVYLSGLEHGYTIAKDPT